MIYNVFDDQVENEIVQYIFVHNILCVFHHIIWYMLIELLVCGFTSNIKKKQKTTNRDLFDIKKKTKSSHWDLFLKYLFGEGYLPGVSSYLFWSYLKKASWKIGIFSMNRHFLEYFDLFDEKIYLPGKLVYVRWTKRASWKSPEKGAPERKILKIFSLAASEANRYSV